jgi:hypothetical protein
MDAKMSIKRMSGIKRGCIQLYLNEFMWRRKSSKRSEVFTKILEVIRAEYPLEPIDYYMDVTDFRFTSSDLDIENDEFEVSNINDDSLLEILTDEDETDNDGNNVDKMITARNETEEEIEERNEANYVPVAMTPIQNKTQKRKLSPSQDLQAKYRVTMDAELKLIEEAKLKKMKKMKKAKPQTTDRVLRSSQSKSN